MGVRHLLKFMKARLSGDVICADGFPVDHEDESREARRLLDDYLAEFTAQLPLSSNRIKPAEYTAGQAILQANPKTQVRVALACYERMLWNSRTNLAAFRRAGGARLMRLKRTPLPFYAIVAVYRGLLGSLLRRKISFDEVQILQLIQLTRVGLNADYWNLPVPGGVGTVERYLAEHPITQEIGQALQAVKKPLARGGTKEANRNIDRIDALLGRPRPFQLAPGTPWADLLLAELGRMDASSRNAWISLLQHAATSQSSRPSNRWLDEASGIIETLGPEAFGECITCCFSSVINAKPESTLGRSQFGVPVEGPFEKNSPCLKGLVWCCSLLREEAMSRAISDLAVACFRKIPMFGPVSEKIGNACLFTLGAMGTQDAVARLEYLKRRIKYRVARKLIDKALQRAAQQAGVAPEELEELAVPSFGLAEGSRRETLGDYIAELRVVGSNQTELC